MRPNPRVQRTRSSPSARHSPLTRHPLGSTCQQLALLVLVLSLAFCSRGPDPAAAAVAKIRNSDISWDGTFVGLVPRITGAGSAEVLKLRDSAIPALVGALDDADRFAAAHVLLTQIQMAGVDRPLSASQWNGLRVELSADGSVRVYPEQREELKAFWRARKGGA